MDNAAAYARIQQRVESIVDDDVADRPVTACPGWTVKDVIAHNAGFIRVYKAEGAQGFGPDWGDKVVAQRRDRSLAENLAEWRELSADPGDLFEGNLGAVAVSDALAHEQDIRSALDRPGAEDDENILPAIQMALGFVEQKIAAEGLPALEVATPDVQQILGEGEPAATLKASTLDLFRTLHGRRTVEQVRAMDWDGDPSPWMSVMFIFGPTEQPVE